MLAIKDAYRAGLFQPKYWMQNIIAGLIVGVVALPLAMAFAIATGVKPEQGLYTAIVAALVVGVLGGSRVQIAGPTGAFIVILAGITAKYGVEGLQVASLLAGVILVLMGFARLGSVIKFIPYPVIVGFTSGIGFIIFVGEWKDFFGLSVHMPLSAHFYQKFQILVAALPQLNLATTLLALLGLLLMIVTPKIFKRLPGPLVAMVVVTLIQAHYQFQGVATLGSTFGGIPQYLPSFHVPDLSLNRLLELIGPAFTIALLGAIESLLSATAADGMAGTRHYSNQELVGQGIANILTPLVGGFAATGAIARTATNIRNGGNSPLAAIVHSIFLVAVIVLLAPLAASIPLCVLAAILFVVAYNMSDIPHFAHMLKHAPGHDVIVLLATFLLTIFTDLVVAVNVGVILAMMFFILHMYQSVGIEKQNYDVLADELLKNGLPAPAKDTLIYAIQGPFFFGVAEKIQRVLTDIHSEPKIIIFRLKDVPFMDMTGLQTFSEITKAFHQRGITVYVCEANHRVNEKLKKIGIAEWACGGRIFDDLGEVLEKTQDHFTLSRDSYLNPT